MVTRATSQMDRLAAAADGLDAETDPAGDGPAGMPTEPGEAAPLSLDQRNAQALCVLLALAREVTSTALVFKPPLTSLAQHLTDAKLPGLAEPWAKVLTHYGVDLGRWAGDSPIVPAILTTGPALWAMASDLRTELAARRAKPVTDAPETPDSADPGRPE